MTSDDVPPPTDGEQEHLPLDDGKIDDDMPCLRCGYNLRGLATEGKCPECGASIQKTVAYVMQRVLCPVCFAPNHPTVALCAKCRSPLTNAAATADYWRPRAITSRPHQNNDDDDQEPDPPSLAWVILCWMFSAICLMNVAAALIELWGPQTGLPEPVEVLWRRRIFTSLLLLAVAAVLGAIMYFPARGYMRLKREYVQKHAAFMAKEEERDRQWKQPGQEEQ